MALSDGRRARTLTLLWPSSGTPGFLTTCCPVMRTAFMMGCSQNIELHQRHCSRCSLFNTTGYLRFFCISFLFSSLVLFLTFICMRIMCFANLIIYHHVFFSSTGWAACASWWSYQGADYSRCCHVSLDSSILTYWFNCMCLYWDSDSRV